MDQKNVTKLIYFVLFILLIILLTSRLVYFNLNSQNYFWDEIVYTHLSEQVKQNTYSSYLGESFRAPLLPFVLSLFSDTTPMHLLMAFLTISSVIMLYLIAKRIFSKKHAIIASLFFASSSLFIYWSFKILAEPLALFLILSSLYLFVLWEQNKKPFYLISSFALAGLAFLARYPAIILICSYLLYLFIKYKFKMFVKKEIWIAGIVFLLFVSPLFYLGVQNYDNPLGMLERNNEVVLESLAIRETRGEQYNWWHYLGQFFPIFGLAGFFFLISLVNTFRETKNQMLLFYILFFAYFVFISFFAPEKFNRFAILILPVLYLIASASIVSITDKSKLLKIICFLAIIVFVVADAFSGISFAITDSKNTAFIIEGTSYLSSLQGDKILCTARPYCSYFGKKESVKFPEEKEDFLTYLEEDSFSYMFIDSNHYPPLYHDYIKENFILVKSYEKGYQFYEIYII